MSEMSDARHVVVVDGYGLTAIAVGEHTEYGGCTVAELWAAIRQHEANCYNAGAVSDGNDEAEVGAMHVSRDMLRELLGLEAE